jgi:WD40 repeat protein
VLWVSFSPDGTRLLTTGFEGVARLWDTSSWAPVGRPMFHAGIAQAEFSPDGAYIITAGAGGQVRVWDGDAADLIMEFAEFPRRVLSFTVGPGPLRATFVVEGTSRPTPRDIPVEEGTLKEIEAVSVVLSGHVIGPGEELWPASREQIETARSFLLGSNPRFFGADEPSRGNSANVVPAEAKSKSAEGIFPSGR